MLVRGLREELGGRGRDAFGVRGFPGVADPVPAARAVWDPVRLGRVRRMLRVVATPRHGIERSVRLFRSHRRVVHAPARERAVALDGDADVTLGVDVSGVPCFGSRVKRWFGSGTDECDSGD